MTGYDQARYDMFRRVRDWGAAQTFFVNAGTGAAALAALGAAIDEIDALASNTRRAKEYRWQQTRHAREALLARMRLIARAAANEGRRTPDAGANFPPLTQRWDMAIVQRARLYIQECAAAREMFLGLGMPPDFIEQLVALTTAFEQCTKVGWQRRFAISSGREFTAQAFAEAFEAVRAIDIVVGNRLTAEPALMAGWKAVRRVDRPRKARSPRAAD